MQALRPKEKALSFCAVLLGALALLAAPPADADGHVPTEWKRKAARVAYEYWRRNRPGRAVCRPKEVKIKQTKSKPGGHWAVAPIRVCGRRARPKPRIRVWHKAGRYGWAVYCTLIVHEWGHLIGLKHHKNPRNVMHGLVGPKNLVKECRLAP